MRHGRPETELNVLEAVGPSTNFLMKGAISRRKMMLAVISAGWLLLSSHSGFH